MPDHQKAYYGSQYSGLPAGITRDSSGNLLWTGECSALSYKAIFTVVRWVIGIVGLVVLIAVYFILKDVLTLELIKWMLIVAGIILAVYCAVTGGMCIIRNGRFKAKFCLMEDGVSVSEINEGPKSVLAFLVAMIAGIISFIFSFWIIFSDNFSDVTHEHLRGGSEEGIYRKVPYKSIREVIVSADGTRIRLKRALGSVVLLVTPGQCGYIRNEIEKRR